MSEVPVRFPARELKTHCDYVRAEDLVVGEVYFRVHFLDDQGLVPELLPREFVGRNLFPADEGGSRFCTSKNLTPPRPPLPRELCPTTWIGVTIMGRLPQKVRRSSVRKRQSIAVWFISRRR